MKDYIVLYRENPFSVLESPLIFMCQADDTDHAEEQCINAYPDCDIIWCYIGKNPKEAYHDYYHGWDD